MMRNLITCLSSISSCPGCLLTLQNWKRFKRWLDKTSQCIKRKTPPLRWRTQNRRLRWSRRGTAWAAFQSSTQTYCQLPLHLIFCKHPFKSHFRHSVATDLQFHESPFAACCACSTPHFFPPLPAFSVSLSFNVGMEGVLILIYDPIGKEWDNNGWYIHIYII